MAEETEEWYDDDKEVLSRAMLKAKEAFDKYINDELGLDGASWDLSMRGFILTGDFDEILSVIEMPADIETHLKNKKINGGKI